MTKTTPFSLMKVWGDIDSVVTTGSIYMWVKSQPSEQLRSSLQASLESRSFVKESYQLAFGTRLSPPQIYFDFKRGLYPGLLHFNDMPYTWEDESHLLLSKVVSLLQAAISSSWQILTCN
jgi:hypothetical protein